MIATMNDAFRPELPIEIIYAQARVCKIVVERGMPGRLLRLCNYLVSTTSLARNGRVHLSRAKVAAIIGVSDRTIDRYFEELEQHGFLKRQVRERAAGKFFFGTCVEWTADLWQLLFVAPGRSRKEAIKERKAEKAGVAAPIKQELSQPPVPDAVREQDGHIAPVIPTDQATTLSHYSSPPITTISKESFFVKDQQAAPTSDSQRLSGEGQSKQPSTKRFHAPLAVKQWAAPLELTDDNLSMLMAVAKKTDVGKTRTRLQDLLAHVGQRLIDGKILAQSASKYLYKCLIANEDYSSARFDCQKGAATKERKEKDAAEALSNEVPFGKVVTIAGMSLMRNEHAIYKVDPVLGFSGPCFVVSRDLMANLAKKAGLCD